MYRVIVQSSRYAEQRKQLNDLYSGFMDVAAALEFAIGKHAEFWPLVSRQSGLRPLTTESRIDDQDGFVTIPRFRVAFLI